MEDTIGERIRAAREQAGWNQKQFAKRLGVSPPSVSLLEGNKSGAPSAETLTRMFENGINIEYIMRAKGPKLLKDIEKALKEDTLHSMIGELDEGEKDMVADVIKGIIRRKPRPSGNDPFKKDPPEGDT